MKRKRFEIWYAKYGFYFLPSIEYNTQHDYPEWYFKFLKFGLIIRTNTNRKPEE
jgi:hypothetical protein